MKIRLCRLLILLRFVATPAAPWSKHDRVLNSPEFCFADNFCPSPPCPARRWRSVCRRKCSSQRTRRYAPARRWEFCSICQITLTFSFMDIIELLRRCIYPWRPLEYYVVLQEIVPDLSYPKRRFSYTQVLRNNTRLREPMSPHP